MQCQNENVSFYERKECKLYPESLGDLDSVAGIRILVTLLGMVGSCSIIALVLLKKRVFNPQIHPIFMLSIADCLLGIFWIAGAGLWLAPAQSYDNRYCYIITVCTVILECVSINLTLVYAIFAFVGTRKTELSTLFDRANKTLGWKFVLLVYLTAWLIPIFLVSIVFITIAGSEHILGNIDSCTCWCIPTVVNIIPFALSSQDRNNEELYEFITRQKDLIYGLGSLTIIHYIMAFIGLSVLYFKVLRKIKSIRQKHDEMVYGRSSNYQYGTTEYSRIVYSQNSARKRVVIFLTVFLVSGICNIVVTSALIGLIEGIPPNPHDHDDPKHNTGKTRFTTFISILLFQSIIMGLQGFVNAIAYGWTRDDFVHILSSPNAINEVKILDNNGQDCDSMNGELKNDIEEAIEQAKNNEVKDDFIETLEQEESSSLSDY